MEAAYSTWHNGDVVDSANTVANLFCAVVSLAPLTKRREDMALYQMRPTRKFADALAIGRFMPN